MSTISAKYNESYTERDREYIGLGKGDYAYLPNGIFMFCKAKESIVKDSSTVKITNGECVNTGGNHKVFAACEKDGYILVKLSSLI